MATAFDPIFEPPATSPFPYGRSPWRCRGSVYRNDLAFCGQLLPGGLDEIFRRAPDPDLQRYLRQSFSAGSFYDVLPIQYLGRVAGRAAGFTHQTYIARAVDWQVEDALRGFSGVVLRSLSADAIAVWIPRLSRWFNEFGSIETRVAAAGEVRGVATGLPQPLVGSWARTASTFVERLLAKVGAASPTAHVLSPEIDGESHGYRTYRIDFVVTWRA
jgi:hypothetical protein